MALVIKCFVRLNKQENCILHLVTSPNPNKSCLSTDFLVFQLTMATNCNICQLLVVKDKGITLDNTYYDHLQREGLSIPTEEVVASFTQMYAVMEAIINDANLGSRFLHYEHIWNWHGPPR